MVKKSRLLECELVVRIENKLSDFLVAPHDVRGVLEF